MPQKTVLITGCSDGGIGSSLAMVFQQRGFHVFASTRHISKMSSLNNLSDVTLLSLDVVKSADIKAAANLIAEKTGGTLDYLVSNAGRNHFMPILDEDLDTVKDIFDINLLGPMALTQAMAPLLIKAKGMAIFITSISGHLNIPYMGNYAGTYSASKRALEIVAETLRLEMAPFGVGVLEIVTGGVCSKGQTYFGDWKLPSQSLYKSIENTIASRAQGKDGLDRMDTMKYATSVVDEAIKRTTGRFWCGVHADKTKMSTTATSVPQSAMDAGAVMGTGLDALP
ncbi:nadph-dependent 1-acyldihydroxyacetone phosphate reductase protein [Trichoderma cornu-damae]|uniref:Nadph-dependent 1-acyldihydroxyacetone phosphate reductase protein n=1 Tax=Trichoderma cornu-damae TaxID=654480 RepID=A0A9P8QTS3_9HYPO|nr:nadph-dependent 1-acyldihydroxyacetone phosphate reductase protein [Trichoderma cornu-damae]